LGLIRTEVNNETLQVVADEDGVGALGLSQTNTSCRQYDATVLDVTVTTRGAVIQVDASPLFPGGGGQPADFGTVNGQPVVEVIDHQHLLLAQPPEGEQVKVEVDWERRFDLMQQHTAQHVISSIALNEFKWATLSFHLSVDSAFVVFDVDALLPGDVHALQARANDVIRTARPIRPRLATEADFTSNQIRCRKLPDQRSGGLRLVEIEGLDLNTCGGTHVDNTAALQMIRLTKADAHRGAVRVYFEAGTRILQRLQKDAVVHYRVNQLLSCSVEQYGDQIERLQKEAKTAVKRIKYLEMSAAEHEAQTVVIDATGTSTLVVTDDRDMGQLNRMAQILTKRAPEHRYVLLSQTSGDDWLILLSGQQTWIDDFGKQLLSRLEARGGGGKGRLQGRTTSGDAVRRYISETRANDTAGKQ
jgi:Ser-tRNA(Ala) deacylase AlaX